MCLFRSEKVLKNYKLGFKTSLRYFGAASSVQYHKGLSPEAIITLFSVSVLSKRMLTKDYKARKKIPNKLKKMNQICELTERPMELKTRALSTYTNLNIFTQNVIVFVNPALALLRASPLSHKV